MWGQRRNVPLYSGRAVTKMLPELIISGRVRQDADRSRMGRTFNRCKGLGGSERRSTALTAYKHVEGRCYVC